MFEAPEGGQPDAVVPTRPRAIVLGDDARRPGVRIAALTDDERYRQARALPGSADLAARLGAGLQAVPGVLVEEGHRGKRLMEVVIDGPLVRAKDGDGLRAWTTTGPNNTISEHARLYDTDKLNTLVNAAAIWQIASVVVAQKHLADISAKLDQIREAVAGISDFLDRERRAKVTGTYEYLAQAVSVLDKGELSPAIRVELESCERELTQIQHHLQSELQSRWQQPVAHKEMFGTEHLQKDTVSKYEALEGPAKDLRLVLKTRALAWYVLSLYPGEQALKQARRERLLHAATEIEAQLTTIAASAEQDCKRFSSMWNNDTTLKIRRTNVREAAQALADRVARGVNDARGDMREADALLLKHDAPTHLVFEVEDGRIGELRMVAH